MRWLRWKDQELVRKEEESPQCREGSRGGRPVMEGRRRKNYEKRVNGTRKNNEKAINSR